MGILFVIKMLYVIIVIFSLENQTSPFCSTGWGDAIHPVLLKGVVWFSRLGSMYLLWHFNPTHNLRDIHNRVTV